MQYLLPIVPQIDETIAEKVGTGIDVLYLALDVDRELIYPPRTFDAELFECHVPHAQSAR